MRRFQLQVAQAHAGNLPGPPVVVGHVEGFLRLVVDEDQQVLRPAPGQGRRGGQGQQESDEHGQASGRGDGLLPLHHGLRFLIRCWIAFFMGRRSFSLLGRASQSAAQLGISMDEVFGSMRDFLPGIVAVPFSAQ